MSNSNFDSNTDSYGVDINNPEFDASGQNKIKSISSASQALQIAVKLARNDLQRDLRRARVLSAFNGASPYCDDDLVQKAQGYRYNVSFGFMEGVIGRAIVPYNDLSINIADLTEIQADLNDEKKSIVQDEFGNIMQKWGKWPKFISRLNQDLVLNGYNAGIFPSDYDPFPIFVQQKNGFVDEFVPNDVNDVEVFVWRKSYMIHELYTKIAEPDIAEQAGWNLANVRNALEGAMPLNPLRGGITTSGQWTAIESAIRGAALFTAIVGAKMINTYHVFASELDGKVSHWICLDDGTNNGYSYQEYGGVELFKKEERFDSMRDFLVYFDLETGDGTWHGSKGVGQRVYNTHAANDKMINSALDTTFTAGLVMLQPGDQLSQEELQLTVVGPFAVIPNGITIQPEVLPNVAPTFFQMQALLSGTSEQRVGDIVPTNQALIQNQAQQTATEAKIRAGRADLISKGNLKRYIDPLSQLISIIVRRLLIKNSPNPFAQEFQDNLRKKGLVDEDLAKIRGARNTGKIEDILGNTAQNTQIIFAEFRGDPNIDQIDLYHRRITSVLDSDAADELIITDKDQTKKIESARAQIEEIGSMEIGKQIPVSPRDDHEIHLQVLLQDIGQKVQSQAQSFNPQIIPVLQQEINHGGGHINFLLEDKTKKKIAKQLEDRLKMSVEAVKSLQKQGLDLAKAHIDQAAKMAANPQEQAQVQQARQQLAQQGGPTPPAPQQQSPQKISESLSFKDLPPEGQKQMAAQVGIQI